MINSLRKKIIVFAAVIVCSFPFMSKKVNAAKVEVLPTATQPSPIGGLTLRYFPEVINKIILKHMPPSNPNYSGGTLFRAVCEKVEITNGNFKVDTPQGLSFTISSSKWFQIRIAQTKVDGGLYTFIMPAIEYRNGEAPPVVAFEGPESEVRRAVNEFMGNNVRFGPIHGDDTNVLPEMLPKEIKVSPEIPQLKYCVFQREVNVAINETLSIDRSELGTVDRLTDWQSPFHKMYEYPEADGTFFATGEDGTVYMICSEGTWFRVRVVESKYNGEVGYSPMVEFREGDNPPKCYVVQ